MRWPSSRDYNEAVQEPEHAFKDAELREAVPTTNSLGLPIARSGGFADVYQLRSTDGKSWAVKCFTKEVSELRHRYQAISEHLAEAHETTKLPFMVDFQYLDDEIRIGSDRYPVLKMTWVEGKLLHEFIREYLDDPIRLEKLSVIWHKLGQNLRTAEMAHGDLQHGNVILVPSARGVLPQLIDYDGMYVPALNEVAASEIGHANYQHPGRDADRFHFEMDRFPLLLIYTAIRCLGVGGRKLWEKFDSGDNLLFKEADIKNPASSALCKELWGLPDPATRALAGWVILASRMPLREVPLLDDIIGIDGKQVPALTAKQEAEVQRLLKPTPSKSSVSLPKAAPQVAAPSSPKLDPLPLPASPKPDPLPLPAPLPEQPRSPRPKPERPLHTKREAVPLEARDEPLRILPLAATVLVCLLVLVGAGFGLAVLLTKSNDPPEVTEYIPVRPIAPPDDLPPEEIIGTAPEQPKKTPESKPFQWRTGPMLMGHPSDVYAVAISADGKRAASGSGDGGMIAWDLGTGRFSRRFLGHWGVVSSVAISADGRWAISGSHDTSVVLWDIQGATPPRQLLGHADHVHSVAISANGKLAVSGGDSAVILWNLETGTSRKFTGHHTDTVRAVAVTPDGKRAISGGDDKTLMVWNLETGAPIRALSGHTGWIRAVAISPDGKRAVSGGDDKTLRVWNLENGEPFPPFNGSTEVIRAVAISADGKWAVSGGDELFMRTWDLEAGKEGNSLAATGQTRAIGVSADGKRAIAGGMRSCVWITADVTDMPKSLIPPPFPPLPFPHPKPPPNGGGTDPIPPKTPPTVGLTASEIILKPGETQTVAVTIDRKGYVGPLTLEMNSLPANVTAKTVTVAPAATTAQFELTATIEAPSGKTTARIQARADGSALRDALDISITIAELPIAPISQVKHGFAVLSVALTSDGKRAVAGDAGGVVRLWEPDTGTKLAALDQDMNSIQSIAISKNKKFVLVGDRKTLRLFNFETGKQVSALNKHAEPISSVAISADGKRGISGGGQEETVHVWNLAGKEELRKFSNQHLGPVNSVAISGDGKRAISGSDDKLVLVWDLENLDLPLRMSGHTNAVHAVAISADGKRAISGGADASVRIWNVETRTELFILTNRFAVHSVAISDDGKWGVSGGADKIIRLWDLSTGKLHRSIEGHTGTIRCLAISADGKRIISGGDDKTVRVWQLAR